MTTWKGQIVAMGAAAVLLCACQGQGMLPVDAGCQQDVDCETGFCGCTAAPPNCGARACSCAPVGHACTVDADCCQAEDCRGFACVVTLVPAVPCTPAGVELYADGGACCPGAIDEGALCCSLVGAACTSDIQCCTQKCEPNVGVGGGALWGGTCCLPSGTALDTCTSDGPASLCCSGYCLVNGTGSGGSCG